MLPLYNISIDERMKKKSCKLIIISYGYAYEHYHLIFGELMITSIA